MSDASAATPRPAGRCPPSCCRRSSRRAATCSPSPTPPARCSGPTRASPRRPATPAGRGDAARLHAARARPAREARLSFARMLSSARPDSGVLAAARRRRRRRSGSTSHSARARRAHRSGPSPTSRARARSAARAARQDELLDTAQEFGRLGIWEREIPSGEGRWDRHVFGFWGLDPAAGTPQLRRRDPAHPSRRSRADDLPRFDAARRPLCAALSRHPARRQDALDPLAVGSEERPARHARPRPRHHDGRHRGLRRGARAERRQRPAQARGRARQDRDLAPRPAHRPHALQRPRLRAARHDAAARGPVDRRGARR